MIYSSDDKYKKRIAAEKYTGYQTLNANFWIHGAYTAKLE